MEICCAEQLVLEKTEIDDLVHEEFAPGIQHDSNEFLVWFLGKSSAEMVIYFIK